MGRRLRRHAEDYVSLPYHHKQPCGCVNCEDVRLLAFRGPGIYKAQLVYGGAVTWTLDAFVWGRRIPSGQLVSVERDVLRHEKGGHLDAVVVWLLEDGADFGKRSRLCTSKRWLEPA